MLTLSARICSHFWRKCSPYFSRWTPLFHSYEPPLVSFSGSSFTGHGPEAAVILWQSSGIKRGISAVMFLSGGNGFCPHTSWHQRMRTSLYLPGQSLSGLFTQMKGEWVLLPLLKNGNVFALIITDDLHPFRSPSPPPHCPTAWNMEGPGQNQEVGNTCLRHLEHPYSLPFPHSEHSSPSIPSIFSSINFLFCFVFWQRSIPLRGE